MTPVIIAVLVPTTALLFVILPALARLLRSTRPEEITAEWLSQFSVQNYRTMDGLLNSEDFEFLSRQPGFDLSLYRKLRRERLQIFRSFLFRMIVDFNRLHTAARMVLSQGPEDQSRVLNQLIVLKLRFCIAVLHAEFSYYLCQIGLQTLPARSLIQELESLSSHLPLVDLKA